MANISGRKARRDGLLPSQAPFGSRWKPFGCPAGIWPKWPGAASERLEISTYSCASPPRA